MTDGETELAEKQLIGEKVYEVHFKRRYGVGIWYYLRAKLASNFLAWQVKSI
jgi:hypothetical protein